MTIVTARKVSQSQCSTPIWGQLCTPIDTIVGYSGALVGAAELANRQIAKPPILLIHGSADPVVPVAALHSAKDGLQKLGIEVTTHISAGLGHSVDIVGLRLGVEFIAKGFGSV